MVGSCLAERQGLADRDPLRSLSLGLGDPSLLREYRLKLGQRVTNHRSSRLHHGPQDRPPEGERCLVAGPDRGPPLVSAGQPDPYSVEPGRREPADYPAPHLHVIAAQHPDATKSLVLHELVLDAVLARAKHRTRRDDMPLLAIQVVHVANLAVDYVQRPPAKRRP